MGLAQGRFHLGRSCAAGKEKAQVGLPFRQGRDGLVQGSADLHILDARHGPGRANALDAGQDACFGDGNHHHAARWRTSFRRSEPGQAARLAHDQLFQRQAGACASGGAPLLEAKAQDAPAQAADRAPGDLQQPGALVVDAQFGVNGAGVQPQRRRCRPGRIGDGRLHSRGQPRGRDIDRLFKKGAVERVGLVEQGQHVQPAAVEHSLQRHFKAGEKGFHQVGVRAGAIFRRQQPRQPPGRQDELGGGVGAHHPAAAVEARGLEHAGIGNLRRHAGGVIAGGEGVEPGTGQPCRRQQPAHEQLVAGGDRRLRCVVRQPQPGGGGGCHDHPAVVHRQDRRQGRRRGIGRDRLYCRRGVVQRQRQQARPLGQQLSGRVRRQVYRCYHFDAGALRRSLEGRVAIAVGRRHQQQAWHQAFLMVGA